MKRKMVRGLTLFCSLVICTSAEAFGQAAYITSFNEPAITIASAPDSTTILSLHNVPPGNYIISAKLNVVGIIADFFGWRIRCLISSSTEKLDIAEWTPTP